MLRSNCLSNTLCFLRRSLNWLRCVIMNSSGSRYNVTAFLILWGQSLIVNALFWWKRSLLLLDFNTRVNIVWKIEGGRTHNFSCYLTATLIILLMICYYFRLKCILLCYRESSKVSLHLLRYNLLSIAFHDLWWLRNYTFHLCAFKYYRSSKSTWL